MHAHDTHGFSEWLASHCIIIIMRKFDVLRPRGAFWHLLQRGRRHDGFVPLGRTVIIITIIVIIIIILFLLIVIIIKLV